MAAVFLAVGAIGFLASLASLRCEPAPQTTDEVCATVDGFQSREELRDWIGAQRVSGGILADILACAIWRPQPLAPRMLP